MYKSSSDIRSHTMCSKVCGVVRCKISLDKVIQRSNFSKRSKNISDKELHRKALKLKLAAYEAKVPNLDPKLLMILGHFVPITIIG